MPGSTAIGIPYPLATEPVAQGAANMKAIADWLDPRLRIVSGTASIPMGGAATAMIVLTFPAGRFSVAPNLIGNTNNVNAFLSTTAPTATQANVWGTMITGASTTTITIRYIAMQAWPGGG